MGITVEFIGFLDVVQAIAETKADLDVRGSTVKDLIG